MLTRAAPDPALLFAPFARHRRWLIAVSGGPDSMALLWLAKASGHDIAAATVDHGMRPQAADEARMVAGFCTAQGVPHTCLKWDGPYPTTRIQERAREARYGLLVAHAHAVGANALMTAHHADDQTETILFRLIGGSGAAGLAGMASESVRDGLPLLRPLLGLRKADLLRVCIDNAVPFVHDPSNNDPRYARTGLRQIAAALEDEGLGPDQWSRFARRMRETGEVAGVAVAEMRARLERSDKAGARTVNFTPLAARPAALVCAVLAAEVLDLSGRTPRLERVEQAGAAIAVALLAQTPWRSTLAGLVLRLGSDGRLTLTPEAQRTRGR